jgi:hypothetical protein
LTFNFSLDAVTYSDFKRQMGHVHTGKVYINHLQKAISVINTGKLRSATAEDHMGYATKGSELVREHGSGNTV